MLAPTDAERIVLENVIALPSEDCPLPLAHGRILRAAVVADRDLPPYDRVTMDGFALRHAAWAAGRREFRITGFQAAGMVPRTIVADDECIEIATGAVLPDGADCVVPYEDAVRNDTLVAATGGLNAGRCIHRKGTDAAAGTVLLEPGWRLDARAVAVAASCGYATLRVATLPRIAVVATGDELVGIEGPPPAPHQIRRSNDHALRAALLMGSRARVERFHLRDLKYELEQQLKRLISEFDVVLLSGGVSKGKFDFLPVVLEQLGVEKKVQGVAQRPGKPFWFGLTSRRTPVFALPGNPVSTLVCFRRYVLPALDRMAGVPPAPAEYAALAAPATPSPAVRVYLPVRLGHASDGRRLAHPAPSNTSGDFRGLAGTDGFVELESGSADIAAGTPVRFWPWD